MNSEFTRRQVVKTMVAGTGLTLGFRLPTVFAKEQEKLELWEMSPWITLHVTGKTIMTVERTEMGQGALQGQAIVLIDEADLDPSSLEFVQATSKDAFKNREYNVQITGGSTSMNQGWDAWREIGATLRDLMIRAAAADWQTSTKGLYTDRGYVYQADGKTKFAYHELLDTAANLDVADVKLKQPSEYKYIGKRSVRFDALSKARGEARFGIDAELEDAKIATIIHCPFFNGRLKQIKNEEKVMTEGIFGIYEISSGVAVVADNYWLAQKTAAELEIEWEDLSSEKHDNQSLLKVFRESLKKSGATIRSEGDVEDVFATDSHIIEAEYVFPFAAHKTMEPMNTACAIANNRCYIISPTQAPVMAVEAAMAVTGFSADQIELDVTYLGGGFGRRLNVDYVREAVEIAYISKTPIKLIWSREEDSKNDFYRPMAVHQFRGSLSKDGFPVAWQHKYTTQPIMPNVVPDWAPAMMPQWFPDFIKDAAGSIAGRLAGMFPAMDVSAEGAKEFPYAVENLEISMLPQKLDIPIGFWRSVGHSLNGPAIECFLDELIEKAGKDPIAYRLKLLEQQKRHYNVVKKVAELANWQNRDQSKIYGVAQHFSFKSYTAQIVQLARIGEEKFKIEKVYCVADCGIVINPDVVAAQLESGVIYGISATLYDEVPIHNNIPQISNFHDSPALRIHQSPDIVTATVESSEKPTGVGEIAVPSVIPALVNAISRGLGRRVRELPIKNYIE